MKTQREKLQLKYIFLLFSSIFFFFHYFVLFCASGAKDETHGFGHSRQVL